MDTCVTSPTNFSGSDRSHENDNDDIYIYNSLSLDPSLPSQPHAPYEYPSPSFMSDEELDAFLDAQDPISNLPTPPPECDLKCHLKMRPAPKAFQPLAYSDASPPRPPVVGPTHAAFYLCDLVAK
ncbi:hypothetical protein LTS18_009355, partial [Coniosporium uncinatum]